MKSCASAPFRRRLHLCLGGVGAAVKDVRAHRAVQQGTVLGHHADGAAQGVLGDLPHVLTVDQDAPSLGIAETQEQIHQAGFTGT